MLQRGNSGYVCDLASSFCKYDVAPYGYLLSDMYLFMADITNPDFLV